MNDPVGERLRGVVHRRLAHTPLERSAVVERELDALLERASATLRVDGGGSNEGTLDIAEANATVLADAMIAAAREEMLADAHESAIRAALAKVCPLWPFC